MEALICDDPDVLTYLGPSPNIIDCQQHTNSRASALGRLRRK